MATKSAEGSSAISYFRLLCYLATGVFAGLFAFALRSGFASPGSQTQPESPNTYLVFLLAGMSLLSLTRRSTVAQILAGLCAISAGVLFVESFHQVPLFLDALVARAAAGSISNLVLVPPVTAIALCSEAGALLLIRRRPESAWNSALLTSALFVTLVSAADHLFQGYGKPRIPVLVSMSLGATLASLLLLTLLLYAHGIHGLLRAAILGRTGALLIRILLPPVLVMPFLLGWLRLKGQQHGWYGTEYGLALLTSTTVVALGLLVWWTARALSRSDAEREQALRGLEEQFEVVAAQRDTLRYQAELIDHSNDAIITMSPQRVITGWNRGAEKLYGWSADEAKGNVIHEFLQTRLILTVHQMDQILLEEGQWEGELVHTTKNGTVITVDSRQLHLHNSEGTPSGILEINRDITHKLSLEGQLRQSQKLESVGQLAGGIAHDFNNLLTVITGYAELIAADHALRTPTRSAVDEIANAANRAASITRQLLTFSRRQVSMVQTVSLNEVIGGVENMLRRLIGENIRLRLDLDKISEPLAQLDPGNLEQIVLNLVINSRDAMPNGGTILVETRVAVVDREITAASLTLQKGPYSVVTVADQGSGMTPELKAKIFDPFFTTKPPGKGTGLGLATVYGIVKQCKGAIVVNSEPGKGTTIDIFLPSAKDLDRRRETVMTSDPQELPGSEQILLVEDEGPLRRYLETVLQQSGYRVLSASNGREALLVLERHHHKIDLLLTDLIMPEMGGVDFAHEFSKIYPQAEVLYMSGYTDRELEIDNLDHFIQKPFTPLMLLAQIKKLLAHSAEKEQSTQESQS